MRFVIRKPSKEELPVWVLGTTWGLIPLGYLTPFGPDPFHLLNATVSAGTIVGQRQSSLPNKSLQLLLIGFIFTLVSFVTELKGTPQFGAYLAMWFFCINLSLLIAALNTSQIEIFASRFFKVTSYVAVLHLALLFAGQIEDHWGRYFFIGDSHPNLGGEIYGIAVAAGALSTSRRTLVIYTLPMLFSAFLMQTRTGLTVMGLTVLFRVCFFDDGGLSAKTFFKGFLASILLLILLSLTPFASDFIADKVFLVNDTSRGADTGFVSGRDSQWAMAWGYFVDSPIWGKGLSFYSGDVAGAHNPILYSLSMFGIFGLLFWLWLLSNARLLLQQGKTILFALAPTGLMLILNDRFMDSNSFPLLYYFFIVQFSRRFKNNRFRQNDVAFAARSYGARA